MSHAYIQLIVGNERHRGWTNQWKCVTKYTNNSSMDARCEKIIICYITYHTSEVKNIYVTSECQFFGCEYICNCRVVSESLVPQRMTYSLSTFKMQTMPLHLNLNF